MSVGTGRQNIIILFWKQQFNFWENLNGNQTFILDSHWPFICSAAGEGKIDNLYSVECTMSFLGEILSVVTD